LVVGYRDWKIALRALGLVVKQVPIPLAVLRARRDRGTDHCQACERECCENERRERANMCCLSLRLQNQYRQSLPIVPIGNPHRASSPARPGRLLWQAALLDRISRTI
jgi:hypothetical protein